MVIKMKSLLIALILAVTATSQAADSHSADVARADAAKTQHETKKVCVDQMKDGKEVKDTKTGKTKQNCKEVKQHKKLEVTK
jgi:Ni/Co efflux regulator RcnB